LEDKIDGFIAFEG